MYAAIDTYLASPQRLLFPTVRDILPRPTLDSGDRDRMDLHNAHILDDPEQLQAVHSVLHHPRGSVPFIIYGPPGTGKTATVVECILQLLIQNPDNRILACAPNNNACNVLTARLAAEPKLEGLMFRLHAFSRSVDDCPEDVQPFAFVNAHGVFGVPPLDILRKHRIVVCTCSSAAFLKSHGLPVGHFSHIIVDEAAQAEEPLAMVPIRAFADVLTNVVLAGDCNQLGPVIYSPAAGNLGLKKSYLERLMHFGETYDTKKQTGHTIVQLLRNRRSHGAIIAWSNKYLYEDTLCAAAHASTARNMLGSPLLPNKTFPVVFHGIKGKQMRGSKSPSWFNIEEASVVRNKCLALLEDKDRPIKEREIGVIAPYKAQVRRIRQLLKSSGIKDVLVCSVEQFQGEERRVIIFSTTRNTPPKGKEGQRVGVRAKIGFVNDRKRINVAFTRAQAMLIVIGDPEALGGHPIWRTFINYVASHGGATAKQPDWNLTTKVPVPGYVEIRVDERSRVGDEYIDKRSATVLRYMGD
ncbi:P-loop containing nucleoside triphosphate hydrolase protein [Auriscalpium vulgare]|uniref:P-loop containing nucleoside triphosphate hydrolase protein n=1 Tax=Auriscalpium vulgare TaxID=40419 RepID=A0ACB8RJM2_9AGAM|nr:P-loop containing nucleoside triphosphate hydrolase protein [Auriscalpium vulgare]